VHSSLTDAADATADPQGVRTRLARLSEAGADLSRPALAGTLVPLLDNSRFLTTWLAKHPHEIDALADLEALHAPLGPEVLQGWYEAALRGDDERAAATALRQMKHRAFVRITTRDVALHAPVPETCRELSAVADVALRNATRFARAAVQERHGAAIDASGHPIAFCVLAMGKLGGLELNYSSDVDLLYFYATDEGSAGQLTPHEHFRRVSEMVTRLVGEVGDQGLVFRVDLRLRPEGNGGPLCNALASTERYYETWGRTWERVAWLRARHVAGDAELSRAVSRTLGPWIYRRTIDYSMIDDVASMKARILAQRKATRALDGTTRLDLKLDRGGIRAIEFFVNALQLVHAGRAPELRDASTLGALERLFAAGHISEGERGALASAYLLFRRVEHRVQMEDERQTQQLPSGPSLSRLARRLGFMGDRPGVELRETIDRHREAVGLLFDALMAEPQSPRIDDEIDRARALLAAPDRARRAALLANAGLADPEQAAHVIEVAGRQPQSPLSRHASTTMGRLGVSLLAEVLHSAEPERALTHLATFASALVGRPIYLRNLAERPRLQRILVSLFAGSDFLSEHLLRRPDLIDELYDRRPPAARPPPTPSNLDTETLIDALGRFKQEQLIRIGLADLAGELDVVAVGRLMTSSAEGVLRAVFERALAETEARRGPPLDASGDRIPCCVVGLGKLGGRELTYGSDLDVVFLYASKGVATDHRGRTSTMLEWATRVAQRTISLLGLPTRSGALFTVDTQLRPGGRQGTLVSRLGRFAEYHEGRAQPWERLALVRARVVAGDPAFAALAGAEIERLTYGRPPPADLRSTMRRLRMRVETEVAREGAGRYNPKSGRGGLVDIEFIAQVLQIEHGGARRKQTLRTPNTLEALDALGEAGLLPQAARLADAWRFLRRLEHRIRVMRAQAVPEIRTAPEALDRLARRLGDRAASMAPSEEGPGERLLQDYLRTTHAVRAQFDSMFGADSGA